MTDTTFEILSYFANRTFLPPHNSSSKNIYNWAKRANFGKHRSVGITNKYPFQINNQLSRFPIYRD